MDKNTKLIIGAVAALGLIVIFGPLITDRIRESRDYVSESEKVQQDLRKEIERIKLERFKLQGYKD
nr:hypothetical protein [uncultured Roseovarius sp.]